MPRSRQYLREHRACRVWLASALLLILGASATHAAQSPPSATVSGQVRTAAGTPLLGAEILLRRIGSAAAPALAHSDAAGRFQFPPLPAGLYRIHVRKAGYAALILERTFAAAQASTLILTLVPSGAVARATVENTPLNGRDWTQLATLQPGVSSVHTQDTSQGHVAQRGFGAALSIGGARPQENDYRLDGISISDYSNGAPGSVVGATLGVDAVQRLSVLGSNYPAAIGRSSGGVISAVTRSGSAAWHGTLYEFLRNSALDARNFFDAARPPFRRNQFGGTAGGPLLRNRWFLFGDFEGLRQSLGVTQVDTVPSAAARAGNLASGPVSVDPAAARFLQALYPLPNGPLLAGGDTGLYSFSGQQNTVENYATGRADWRHPHATLSAIYLFDTSTVTQPDAFDFLLSNVRSRRQMFALESERRPSPNWINQARFGFTRATAVDGGLSQVLNSAVTDPALGLAPGKYVGGISIAGLTSLAGGPDFGRPFLNGSKTFAWNSFQGYDDLAYIHGAHTLQFGAAVERMQSNVSIIADTNGNFSFASLADFLTNQPLTYSAPSSLPVGVFGIRQTLAGAYLQDAIQAAPHLLLSVGLRYEMTTIPAEAHNRLANLPQLTATAAHLGSPFFLNPTLHNWEPRLGLSWQPWPATTVRSGFGIFDVLPLPYLFNIIIPEAYPYYEEYFLTQVPVGSFPSAAYPLATSNPAALRTSYVERDPHRSYVMQWNFGIAHLLASTWRLDVSYDGSRSVHLPLRTDDFDTVMPTLTPGGYLYPPAATSQRLNPDFGRISGITWNADAYYDALEASLSRTLPRGLTAQASYTWGKAIDTGTASITSDQFDNSLVNMPWFDTRLDRGPSDLNITQNFVGDVTWQLPSPGTNRSWRRLLSDWQLGGIYTAQSGSPFTVELAGDPLGTKLTSATELPNVLPGPGCASLVNPGDPNHYVKTQCFAFPQPARLSGDLGRNRLTGPGLFNLDAALIKTTGPLQFRAEFFNLLNRPDFAPPLSHLAVFNPGGSPIAGAGLITSTDHPQREIQLAIKYLF